MVCSDNKCPATMCPLFAAEGSVWTGEKDADCAGSACDWWRAFGGPGCDGATAALEQLAEATDGASVLQLGPGRRHDQVRARSFDCPKAERCQWQVQQPAGQLCPPRRALAEGLDPRLCAW